MKRLLNRLHQADRSGRLFPPHSSVLIALSGGPDSVCLTLLLNAWRRSRSIRLAAAHVNHGLRPSAAADERWVQKFCARLGLEYFSLKVDVWRRAKAESESIEEAARRGRYQALLKLAQKEKFDCLATAHTADDQAETVLMRLASGSGLWGLAAIPTVRMEGGVRILRPLLGISKKDILAALKRARADWRTDASNTNRDFLRNRVRSELLPRLSRDLNPRISEHLSDLAADAGVWREWAEGEADAFLRRFASIQKNLIRLPEKALKRLPPPLRAPVYFKICRLLTGREQHLRREHVRQIEELLQERGAAERRLAVGIVVRRPAGRGDARIVWSARGQAGRAR